MIDLALFKQMYRMMDYQRRISLIRAFRAYDHSQLPEKFTYRQLDYLMLIRAAMPCNLSQVMELTGLSSAAASLFVDKMVHSDMLTRELDPRDRRNVTIGVSQRFQKFLAEIDKDFDAFIDEHLRDCSGEELQALEHASALVCRKIAELNRKTETKRKK